MGKVKLIAFALFALAACFYGQESFASCVLAGNAPMTNFAVTHVLPRIAQSDPAAGYLTESLIAAIAQGDDEAKTRLKAFLEKRAPKTVRN